MMYRIAAMCALSLLLAACGSATTSAGRSGPTSAGMRPATTDHRGGSLPSAAQQAPGEIMGRDRNALITLFGQPRVDMQEGTATRMQFGSDRCVLDAYLYAPRNGAQPVVTHVDARTPTGADTDRSGCIAALRRR
jgi:hypothetical protein